MGYNATYGYKSIDSMDEIPLKTSKDGTINFLCEDSAGQLKVSTEYAVCEGCGKPLAENEIIYEKAGGRKYCKACELKNRIKNRKTKNKRTVKK